MLSVAILLIGLATSSSFIASAPCPALLTRPAPLSRPYAPPQPAKRTNKKPRPVWKASPTGAGIPKVEDSQMWIEDEITKKVTFALSDVIKRTGELQGGAEGDEMEGSDMNSRFGYCELRRQLKPHIISREGR